MIQSVNYVRQRMMNDLINLMSIKSTVCRTHNAKLVLLGNDISVNLINPVTVCFNLLERLEINKPITDTVTIDDREYRFTFLYFDFPGSVEHWFINPDLDINNAIHIYEGCPAFDMVIITEFKKYYIYKLKGFIYISSQNVNKRYQFCDSCIEFFKKYDMEHLLKSYSLDVALQILQLSGVCSNDDIVYYFGDRWYKEPVFRRPVILHSDTVLNLPELCKMKYNDLIESAVYPKLKQLSDIVCDNTVIYDNAQIKILITEIVNRVNLI
jgi:hypothetical protein